jgi:hypothetical protein
MTRVPPIDLKFLNEGRQAVQELQIGGTRRRPAATAEEQSCRLP